MKYSCKTLAGVLIACLALPLQASAESVEERLTRVERLVQSQGLIQLMNQVDQLQLELQKLRGEIEFQNHTLEQIKQRQRDLYIDLDRRMQNLSATPVAPAPVAASGEPAVVADPANPPLQTLPTSPALNAPVETGENSAGPLTVEVNVPQAETTPPPAVATTETISITTEEDLQQQKSAAAEQAYQAAFELLKNAHHEEAMKAFSAYIEQYPDSQYAANAQYWLGEAYYVKLRFQEAIAEFRLLVENYPDSQKLTHSLLKIGYSLHELKQYDEAIKVLEDLQSRYPGSSAARYAGERLQRIRAEQQAGAGNSNQG